MTVDIEKLKRPDPCPQGFTDYNMGWNECIDYLHSRGYLGGVWQPIETAPKDSGTFLICLPRMMNLIIRARYNTVHGHWLSDRETGDGITNLEYFHPGDLWMPLPAPPKGEMK